MAINFPDNPSIGDLFSSNNITRQWNGVTWAIAPTTIQGPTGARGVQGAQGLQGYQGRYTISTTAPSSPDTGSAWLNSNDGSLYIWDGTQWFEPYDNLVGTQGIQGIAGIGTQATQGIQGVLGIQGVQGIQGTNTTITTINTQSTNYTLVTADQDKMINATGTGAQYISIPTNASAPFPIGSVVHISALGLGTYTIQAVTSATTAVQSTATIPSRPNLRTLYSSADALKIATDTWLILGDLS